MLQWKIDVMATLKNAGYSTYRIRQQNLIGQQMLTKIRNGELPSWAVIDKLCKWLDCQPGDLVEYIDDSEQEEAPGA